MNRKTAVFLLMILGLVSCQSKVIRRETDPDRTDVGKKKSPAHSIDTSFIQLRKMHSISINDLISQHWEMEDADQVVWNELFWDSVLNKRKYPAVDFFSDFTVTENARGSIRMGKWKLDKEKSELSMNFSDGTQKKYIISEISIATMKVNWEHRDNSVLIKFSSDALERKSPAEDPFYPANNSWRIKPAAAENAEQIRKRVKDFVHFFALFYNDNYDRQETDISFIGLPNCFVWYNGGIGLDGPGVLDFKWNNCFFSDDQAMKGYDLIKAVIEKHNLKWDEHPTNWVKQTGEVLVQIYNQL